MTLTSDEKKLLNSKTPEKFIDNSVKLTDITSGRKAYVCKLWLKQNREYTIDDIGYARNRHPYWKKRKRGSEEKKEQRLIENNFMKQRKQHWSEKDLMHYIDLDEKDKDGRYKYKDRELAKIFESSIPGIQHVRRKVNLAKKILETQNLKINKKNIYNYLYDYSEERLRNLYRSLENKNKKKKKK